jgi:hypothetical protein
MDLRKFYEEQLGLIRRRDVADLVTKHYRPAAILIAPNGAVQGEPALKQLFRDYIPTVGKFLVDTKTFVAAGDVFVAEAEINTSAQARRADDAFLSSDERIVRDFAGVLS